MALPPIQRVRIRQLPVPGFEPRGFAPPDQTDRAQGYRPESQLYGDLSRVMGPVQRRPPFPVYTPPPGFYESDTDLSPNGLPGRAQPVQDWVAILRAALGGLLR